jgi:uncharacterized ion transporter superfamily protein YfcC
MKSIFFIVLSICVFTASKAAVIKEGPASQKIDYTLASEFDISKLSAVQVLSFTPSNYFEITGKKMSFKEKTALKLLQRNLKKAIRKNPDISMESFLSNQQKSNAGLGILLWILLIGAFIGVVILLAGSE